jgi:hypothetical protein
LSESKERRKNTWGKRRHRKHKFEVRRGYRKNPGNGNHSWL